MASGSGAGVLHPTFEGFVSSSTDSLLLFEACLSGTLHHVPRRPHDRERSSLIRSGSVFIYEENASGIKRWTDGVAWSPSRILDNFLIYRELEKPFGPGEKKRAMKRKHSNVSGESYPRRASDEDGNRATSTLLTPTEPVNQSVIKSGMSGDQDKELERSLIGSLVDSYGFRPNGLVKKTMSVSINGITHHMVSYYKVDDVINKMLQRPESDPRMQGLMIRPELFTNQNFRAPINPPDRIPMHIQMPGYYQTPQDPSRLAFPSFQSRRPSAISAGRPATIPPSLQNPAAPTYSPSGYWQPSPQYNARPGQYIAQPYPMNSLNAPTTNMYGNMPGSTWSTLQVAPNPVAYGSHPNYSSQGYGTEYYPKPAWYGQ
ncbi:hypothetical protein LTR08_006034 [Meristemomyces frigidus]|nr:hypothetical protein LTR08_006034 [Meristemomyces frigidus]